jgi:hypothetical protein
MPAPIVSSAEVARELRMQVLKRLRVLEAFTVALTLLLPRTVIGWGPVGHETIAYIAQGRLTPAVLLKIHAIIDREDDLAKIANWADEMRDFQPETKSWHYIDLPIRQNLQAGDVHNFCPRNDCVIAQIQISKGVLTDPSQSQREKLRALKFLVHFVGDLHQPLHTADDGDHGGNDKTIRFQEEPMKLHGLWDDLIEKQATENPSKFATELASKITAAKVHQWLEGDEITWALEGYKIAKEQIYKNYPPGPQDLTNVNLGNAYYKQMRPIVEEQLQKASVRLTKILQEIFGN